MFVILAFITILDKLSNTFGWNIPSLHFNKKKNKKQTSL